MSKNRNIIMFIFCALIETISAQNILFNHAAFPPEPYNDNKYVVFEQRQLSWLMQNDKNVKNIKLHTRRHKLSHSKNQIREYTLDSVYCIPDSIILFKNLEVIEINLDGMQYISPNLSLLTKLHTIEYFNFGKGSTINCIIPSLPQIKNALISASDSITIHKVLRACPNLNHLELHLEAYTHWNFTDMLQYNPKLKVLTIPWWEGLPPESNRKYTVLGDESWGYDTMGIHFQYIDLDLSHCKHLRRIETDYKLSPEMQKYCRKHCIRVVKFSRKEPWWRRRKY